MDEQGYQRAAPGVIGVDPDEYSLKFNVLPGLMPDPRFNGLQAELNVNRVRPLYENDQSRSVPIVVLIHGRTVPGPVVFDLRDPPGGGDLRLSVQKALAWQGIDTFAPSLLGYGKSTRFEQGLDDPGNASLPNDSTLIPLINPLKQQQDMLFVHPLAGQTRPHSSKSRFARTDVWVRDIAQVIDDALVRNKDDYREGREKVALLGYSLGGQRVGRALYADNPVVGNRLIERVSHVVFLNSIFGGQINEPDPPPPPTFPLTLNDQTTPPGSASDNLWQMPPSSTTECPGRIIQGTQDQVWRQTLEHESKGLLWGGTNPDLPPTGLNRSPTFSGYGWNPEVAGQMRTSTPTLVIQGLEDGSLPRGPFPGQAGPQTGQEIYRALPAAMNKVLVQVECASHVLQWEGARDWPGPHYMLKQALIEWIKEGRFNRVPRGGFIVDNKGDVKRDPANPPS